MCVCVEGGGGLPLDPPLLSSTQRVSNGGDVWQIPVKCGFRAGLWDFSPNSLPRRLEAVLELIAERDVAPW